MTASITFIFLYYVILALALLTYFVTNRLRRLPIGRAWEALREDEIACRSLGINTTNTKLTAFAIGAMFGGFAGSFFAARQGFVSPESFVFIESAIILAIVVLGGLGSQIGIVFAAIAIMGSFELFRELTWFQAVPARGHRPRALPHAGGGPRHGADDALQATRLRDETPAHRVPEGGKAVSGDLVKEGHG